MEHLFESLTSVMEALAGSPRTLLLLDYDGTLTPIVDRPERAVIGDDTRNLLRELASNPFYTLGVVSGRSLDEVRRIVGLESIYYAGNHGLEASGPGFEYVHPGVGGIQGVVDGISSELQTLSERFDGVLVENKRLSVVLHYRMVSDSETEAVREAFMEVARPRLDKGFRLAENRKTLELAPDVGWGKGEIVLELVDAVTARSDGRPSVIYIGDDDTDEDAFKALAADGVTVVVGEKESSARYFVRDVGEVRQFLRFLRGLAE
jgi:trehalose 6-phosphate phosphatase